MRTDVNAIQADLNQMENAMQNTPDSGERETYRVEAEKYREELRAAQAYHAEQASLETRVEEAKENGYLLDTLTASNGMSMGELSYSPENHELVCIAVQKAFLAQQDAFNVKIGEYESKIRQWEVSADKWSETNSSLERVNFTLEQEKQEAYQKLANATAIIEEKDAEIKALKAQQMSVQAVEVAPLSAEEQEAKLINELNGKRIKVINLHPKSDDFNNKMFVATNALTGVEFEDYLLYSKRYEEISLEAAAELQADFQAKKDAIAKANEIPDLPIINDGTDTLEDKISMEEQADTQDQVPPVDNRGNDEMAGNGAADEMVGQAAEIGCNPDDIEYFEDETVINFTYAHEQLLELLDAKVATLLNRVEDLEQGANRYQ